jgi:signal transduction histidine kinase
VALTRFRERIRLEVIDNGPGLPPGIIDRVFDPFFTTKDPNQGTGLGLSICYGIARALDGNITCGNRPESGAWFRVSLPINRTRKGAPMAETAR